MGNQNGPPFPYVHMNEVCPRENFERESDRGLPPPQDVSPGGNQGDAPAAPRSSAAKSAPSVSGKKMKNPRLPKDIYSWSAPDSDDEDRTSREAFRQLHSNVQATLVAELLDTQEHGELISRNAVARKLGVSFYDVAAAEKEGELRKGRQGSLPSKGEVNAGLMFLQSRKLPASLLDWYVDLAE